MGEYTNMEIILIRLTKNPERLIELAARTSTRSWDEMDDAVDEELVRYLIKKGHFSAIEHASATFLIKGISRACSHQLVRHRMASYTQSSQRYVDENDFDYVVPESIKNKTDPGAKMGFEVLMRHINEEYKSLRDYIGIPKEDARFVLPNACTTDILMTANFREWRHIFELRGSKESQWEIREVAIRIFNTLKTFAPNIFFDMEIELDEGVEMIKKNDG